MGKLERGHLHCLKTPAWLHPLTPCHHRRPILLEPGDLWSGNHCEFLSQMAFSSLPRLPTCCKPHMGLVVMGTSHMHTPKSRSPAASLVLTQAAQFQRSRQTTPHRRNSATKMNSPVQGKMETHGEFWSKIQGNPETAGSPLSNDFSISSTPPSLPAERVCCEHSILSHAWTDPDCYQDAEPSQRGS